MKRLLLLLLLPLAACATPAIPPPPTTIVRSNADQHLPPYARMPVKPFTAATSVAIARREWRAFGSIVNDDPGDTPITRADRPDKHNGLWQRVSDYWWFGQDYGAPEGSWSSKYNENGTDYTADAPAWSAAFISYIMRASGAQTRFPYSPLHSDYINAAARNEAGVHAERPETYAPRPGDIICTSRGRRVPLRFDDLPTGRFFGHCDIVVSAAPGQLEVIGGNVFGGVTLKHVPTTPQGMLSTPDGTVMDSRYPWFVTLRVDYDPPAPDAFGPIADTAGTDETGTRPRHAAYAPPKKALKPTKPTKPTRPNLLR